MNSFSNKVINFAFRVQPLTEEERDYAISGYTLENSTDLKDTLKVKKVRPVVGKMMMGLGIDTDYWQEEYNHFKKRNELVIAEVDRIFDALHQNGIMHAFAYENFGALLSSETDTALYSSGDVDLFADVCMKPQITEVMSSLGYLPTRDIYDERNIMTEYLKEDGIIRINFDWIILRRMMFPIDVSLDGVINWNSLRTYRNTNIKLPSIEALLYLCLLRIAVHGFSRSPDARLYIDVQNAVCTNPNWDTVLNWAKRDGVLTKIVVVATIAHKLNGVSVPETILSMANENAYAQRIMKICYDDATRSLRYDPSGLELMKVEAASDDRSVVSQVMHLLFPSNKFLKMFYEKEGDPFLIKYINYYKHLIGK